MLIDIFIVFVMPIVLLVFMVVAMLTVVVIWNVGVEGIDKDRWKNERELKNIKSPIYKFEDWTGKE